MSDPEADPEVPEEGRPVRERDAPSPLGRRGFLRLGAAGGLAAAVPGAGAWTGRAGEPGPGSERAPGDGSAPESRGAWEDFELTGAGVADLQEAMESGEWSSREIAARYIERIRALDRRGPELRQVLEVNPDALPVAGRLDRERERGEIRGPLHGIPVILKDNIDTGDRMDTAAGSLALAGTSAPRDAFIVERLREAGAVILAKANLSEWANFRSTESSSGWSGRGGQGKNPYALDRTPCGSSSGSAAAVAAEYAPLAIGTETDGSVTCPSSMCSVVGVKPTLGLWSRSGIVPIAHSQDTAGPMAKSVEDAAILLGALTGLDPRDPRTEESRGEVPPDYTQFLDPAGLEGARLGVARSDFFGYTEETDRVGEEALAALEAAGAELVDDVDIPHSGEYGDDEWTVLQYEFRADLNAYLEDRARRAGELPVESLEDVIRFNEENADREMPWFGQDLLEMSAEKGSLESEEYREALERSKRLAGPRGIDAALEEHDLDALVGMTTAPPWPIDLVNGDAGGGSATTPAAVAGYPHVTVPAGYVHGLPVGFSFVGTAWSEAELLRFAHAFEVEMDARERPRFRTTGELRRTS